MSMRADRHQAACLADNPNLTITQAFKHMFSREINHTQAQTASLI